MKKTLLATAIAGSMAATGAQAATVYDEAGKSLDISGRIGVGVESDYAGKSDFVNTGSRLKLDGSNQFTRDTRAFAHVEWRFNADERDQNSGFSEVRHAWVGVEDARYGTVMAGNFDNAYASNVFGPFDYYAMSSGYGFASMETNGRGDSVAYYTPDLQGFQAFVQATHYAQQDLGLGDGYNIGQADSAEVLAAGGVTYDFQDLTLALGFTEAPSVDGTPGDADSEFDRALIVGARASYAFNDQFSARIGYEDQEQHFAAGGTDYQGDFSGDFQQAQEVFGIGGLYSIGQVTLTADYYNKDMKDTDETRNEYALGGYYRFADNMDVFTEIHDNDTDDDTYFIVGSRYFF